MEMTKLTEGQINDYVQSLVKDIYIGNGEPSLRQTVRDTHKLLLDHIARWEAKDAEHKKEKEKMEQDKLDALLLVEEETKKSKTFWVRSIGILIITQIAIFVFSFLH